MTFYGNNETNGNMETNVKRYENAGAGLQKMYIQIIGAMVCGVLLVIPIIQIIGVIGAFVLSIIGIVGLYQLAKDISGCMAAFVLEIISIILGFFDIPFISDILAIAIFCIIVTSVTKELHANGVEGVKEQGTRTVCIYVVLHILSAVISTSGAISAILSDGIGTLLLSVIISLVLSISSLVVELKFYRSISEHFGVYLKLY